MEYMEQKMQDQMMAGEAKMEYLCDVMKKIEAFCSENNITKKEILESFRLFKYMDWETNFFEEGDTLYFKYNFGSKKTKGTVVSENKKTVLVNTDLASVGIKRMSKKTGLIKTSNVKNQLTRISKKEYDSL